MAQDVIPAGSFHISSPGRPEGGGGQETLNQLLFVVFKWKRLVLSVVLVITVAAGIAIWMKPPVRSATAEIMIKVDRLPLQISGLAARPEKNQVAQIMTSEIRLIKSRQVLNSVAMKLLSGAEKRSVGKDELEDKINSLADNTVPVAVPDSTVLQITYFARTSEEAEHTLSLIIDEYIEKQAAIQSGSDKLLKFYEQEKLRVESDLRAAEDQLNEWQGKNETVSISQQIASQIQILEDRRKTFQQTEAQLEATKAKTTTVRNQLQAQPERLLMGQEQVKNPIAMKLKEQLLAAEASVQDLLQRFTEKHRSVQEKKEQIAFLKKELAAAEENIIGQQTTGLNPLKENLKHQFSDGQALLSSLQSQKEIVGKQVLDASMGLATLREKKVKIDELSRVVELYKDAFMLYGKKLEEGRIATGLGKEQLANVALIGPAHAAGDADPGIRMVVLSAFVGLALGLALAFGLEFFNSTLRTRHDAEYYLGVPVLAAIPDLRITRPLINQ